MKAAVATGNQTHTAEVRSGGAKSISSRERRKGGVDGYRLLSEALFGMWAFYVVRKHTTVRHNKWSDGVITEALLMVRGAQRDGTL